jgi:hypothetical protein
MPSKITREKCNVGLVPFSFLFCALLKLPQKHQQWKPLKPHLSTWRQRWHIPTLDAHNRSISPKKIVKYNPQNITISGHHSSISSLIQDLLVCLHHLSWLFFFYFMVSLLKFQYFLFNLKYFSITFMLFFTFIFLTTSFILIALSDIVKHHDYDALAFVVVIGSMIWLFSFLNSVVINIIN